MPPSLSSIQEAYLHIELDWSFHSSTLGPGGSVHDFTTKDTKSTKDSENETLDAIFPLCNVTVHQ